MGIEFTCPLIPWPKPGRTHVFRAPIASRRVPTGRRFPNRAGSAEGRLRSGTWGGPIATRSWEGRGLSLLRRPIHVPSSGPASDLPPPGRSSDRGPIRTASGFGGASGRWPARSPPGRASAGRSGSSGKPSDRGRRRLEPATLPTPEAGFAIVPAIDIAREDHLHPSADLVGSVAEPLPTGPGPWAERDLRGVHLRDRAVVRVPRPPSPLRAGPSKPSDPFSPFFPMGGTRAGCGGRRPSP